MTSTPPRVASTFFSLEDEPGPGWNTRLLRPPTGVSIVTMNEVSRAGAQGLREAIAAGQIDLVPVERCNCGGTRLERLSAYDRYGLDFSTVICRDCGLIRLDPYIAEASLAKYYDDFYHPLHFGTASLDARPALFMEGQGGRIYEQLAALLPSRVPLRVLEIGAGTGSVLLELESAAARNGHALETLGTELSHDCIRVGRQRGANLVYGAFDEIISRGERFDVVILSHVFEHFTDLPRELAKLDMVLADAGLVYVEVPGLMVLHKREAYRFDYFRYVTHAHVFHFNLTSLASIFGGAGYRLVSGNEEVEAVFRKGAMRVDSRENYDNVITYLKFIELNGQYFRDRHHERAATQLQADRNLFALQTEKRAHEHSKKQLTTLESEVLQMNNSKSWRMTAPLRDAHRLVRRLRQR